MKDYLNSQEIELLEKLMDPSFPELWADISVIIFTRLLKGKPDFSSHESIAKTAIEITTDMGLELGGYMYYFPKGKYAKAASKARKIQTEFNGRNHKELAKKYALTEARIRQILAQKKSVTKNQNSTI